MKQITIKVYPNGKSKLTIASLHYNAENRASNVVIDFTEDGYVASWTKKADVVVSNNNTGRIFTGTTDAILSFDLTLDLMKTGTLTIYPYATRINNAEDEKVVYQAQVINVADFADLLGTDTTVTPSLAEQLQDQIDVIDATLLEKMDTDGSNSNVDVMTFNPDIAPVVIEGQISYNNESRTFQGGLGNDVVGSFFQETYYPDTINSDTVTIPNGALVQYDGAVGNSGVIRVKRCLTNVALAGAIMGVATENIPVNQKGKITWFGKVNGIQTNGANYGETWVDGDMLYNHPSIVGGLSKTKPIAPKSASFVGIVVNAHASNGQLLIRPMFFPKIGQLSDVYTNGGIADGQVLLYDFVNARWHNAKLDSTQVTHGVGNVSDAINAKQPTLVSGTNIKTVNSNSLLGSGDVLLNATSIPNTPAGNISAITVQGAINELDTEKAEKITSSNRFVRALGTKFVENNEPITLTVMGDSTGNATDEWVYLFTSWLSQQKTSFSTYYRLWNDTNQAYDAPIRLSTGSAGDAYATFDSMVATDKISTPNRAANTITGDIDIIAKIAPDVWSSAAVQTIISKFGGAGQRGWVFRLNGGRLAFWWSNDGTANTILYSDYLPVMSGGTIMWVRCTMDVDNGSGLYELKFYTSPDGSTWTQSGSTQTGTATSLFATNNPIYIAGRGGGDLFQGKIYSVIVKSGINGKPILNVDFGMAFPSTTLTFTDTEGNVWSWLSTYGVTVGNGSPSLLVLNASASGAAISYFTDATRFGLMTARESSLVFLSLGHNQSNSTDIATIYEGLISQILTKYPYSGVVCIAQNPQVSPAVNRIYHGQRCRQIAQIVAKGDYGFVDVYRAFMSTGAPADYIATDGVHPLATGQSLWLEEVKKFMSGI